MANEIQRVYWGSQVSPVAASDLEDGTFEITFDGETTSALNYNDSAYTIQLALEALSNIGSGNVAVTLTADGFIIEFQGTLANTGVPQITLNGVSLKVRADTITVEELQSGIAAVETIPSATTTRSAVSPVNEVQVVNLGGATTGTFDLNGNSTSATVTTLDQLGVQTACDNIWGWGQTVVSDIGGGTYHVTFSGAWVDETDHPEMTVTNNTTDGSPTVSTVTNGVTGVSQQDTISLSTGAAISGQFTINGTPWNYDQTPTDGSWTASNAASAGNIVITWNDTNYHANVSVSQGTPPLITSAGQTHQVRVTLADSPTEGMWRLSVGGPYTTGLLYNSSAQSIATLLTGIGFDCTGSGDAGGPYTFTSTSSIADPGTPAGDDSGGDQLRKGLPSYEAVTTQAGSPLAPVADFSATPTTGTAPQSVDFTDLSTNTPTGWTWERSSDGGSNWTQFSTDQNPSTISFSAGTWAIKLTASNGGGSDSETKLAYITVAEASGGSAVGSKFVGRFSGMVTYTDGSHDEFAAHIDDHGNIIVNDQNGSQAVLEVQTDQDWLESMLGLVSNTLTLSPSGVAVKTVNDAVLHLSGRVARADNTWADFAVQYNHQSGSTILSGDVAAYNEFASATVRSWLGAIVGVNNVTT